MSTVEIPTPETPAMFPGARVTGNEIGGVNAWGWLLARAGRLAKILEGWPQAQQVISRVLAGMDIMAHTEGIDPENYGKHFDVDVTCNAHQRYIIIKFVER